MARRHVGDQSFAVMLGDDIMHERSPVLASMIAAAEARDASVLALKEVLPEEISAYGAATVEPDSGDVVRVLDVVEKPKAAEAPSNLAVIGRYVLSPGIFDALDRITPGAGGELQLTDAIKLLIEDEAVYGWTFSEGRFDVGNKIDYLKATVELALERPDLGPPLRAYLEELLAR
jgi:UTP--glucose-1-phosphate uridylyltransferase